MIKSIKKFISKLEVSNYVHCEVFIAVPVILYFGVILTLIYLK